MRRDKEDPTKKKKWEREDKAIYVCNLEWKLDNFGLIWWLVVSFFFFFFCG